MINFVIKNLKKIIKKSGLNQKEIAKILDIGEIHLSKIMNGKASLTQNLAYKLSKITQLHTNEHDLLYPKCKNKKKTTYEQFYFQFPQK